MAKSASLLLPFELDIQTQSLKRATTINDTLKSSILCFLLTEKGQRRGNPIGSTLPTLQHQLISNAELKEKAEQVKKELVAQFPGVVFNTVQLTRDFEDQQSNLQVAIEFSTALTDISQLQFML